jgi:hypothetical protein
MCSPHLLVKYSIYWVPHCIDKIKRLPTYILTVYTLSGKKRILIFRSETTENGANYYCYLVQAVRLN